MKSSSQHTTGKKKKEDHQLLEDYGKMEFELCNGDWLAFGGGGGGEGKGHSKYTLS